MTRAIVATAGFLLFLTSLAPAQESPIISAMQDELRRSMAELRMKDEAPPYFIAYEVLDRTLFEVAGRLGAVIEDQPRRVRTLRAEVRVGDYAFDSSRFVLQGFGGAALTGETAVAPLDDNYSAIRREIWMTTDAAYKRAVAVFARKKAAFQNRAASNPLPDFSKETPVETILPIPFMAPDDGRTEAGSRARVASAAFADYPDVDISEALITKVQGTRYYLNSEGFKSVTPIRIVELSMYGEAQAGDGMPVRRTLRLLAPTVDDLPPGQELAARAKDLASEVSAVRAAPFGEEFAGPVMIEGVGSPQFFSETLVQMLQARRPPDAENPRMMQGGVSPFLNRTGLRVMADAFAVRDTPSLTTFEGKPLSGSYAVDDEGLKASDVTLVEKGRLATLLTARTPQRNFPQSNGHGRSGVVLAGVLRIESTQAIPAAELKQKYLALLRAQNRPFGYIVRGVSPDSDGNGPGIDSLVRVTVDGQESPVRGMRFGSVPPTAFRDLAEASQEQAVYSYRAGSVSAVSVIAPSVIFEELEIQRVRDILQKPPVVPSPLRK